jgi:hypothetical protein
MNAFMFIGRWSCIPKLLTLGNDSPDSSAMCSCTCTILSLTNLETARNVCWMSILDKLNFNQVLLPRCSTRGSSKSQRAYFGKAKLRSCLLLFPTVKFHPLVRWQACGLSSQVLTVCKRLGHIHYCHSCYRGTSYTNRSTRAPTTIYSARVEVLTSSTHWVFGSLGDRLIARLTLAFTAPRQSSQTTMYDTFNISN